MFAQPASNRNAAGAAMIFQSRLPPRMVELGVRGLGHDTLEGFHENLHRLRAGDSVFAGKIDRGCGLHPGVQRLDVIRPDALFRIRVGQDIAHDRGLRPQPLGGGHEHARVVDVQALDQMRSLHGLQEIALPLRELSGEGLDGDCSGSGMGVGEIAARHEFGIDRLAPGVAFRHRPVTHDGLLAGGTIVRLGREEKGAIPDGEEPARHLPQFSQPPGCDQAPGSVDAIGIRGFDDWFVRQCKALIVRRI